MESLILNIFLFFFGSIGLTHILVDGDIAEPLRKFAGNYFPWKFKNVFNCYLCAGFWSGLIVGTLVVSDKINLIIACGFSSAILSMCSATILNFIEAKSIVYKEDNK